MEIEYWLCQSVKKYKTYDVILKGSGYTLKMLGELLRLINLNCRANFDIYVFMCLG